MAAWQELLGEHLIENRTDQVAEAFRQVSIDELNNKVVGLYFSAHWCPPCRAFTPILADAYKKADAAAKEKFEIVFISSDRDESSFDEYFHEMPWKALPFSDRKTKEKLAKQFNIRGIPTLVILSTDGTTLTTDARSEITNSGARAIECWAEGKKSVKSQDDE